jgi:hypothetical protein
VKPELFYVYENIECFAQFFPCFFLYVAQPFTTRVGVCKKYYYELSDNKKCGWVEIHQWKWVMSCNIQKYGWKAIVLNLLSG